MSYWLIKAILLLGLLLVGIIMLRPVKNASHLALRRIGMMAITVLAAFSVVFPEILNGVARAIGVESGTNLLVYILVIAVFTQMASSYRRDVATQRKLTNLARTLAIESAQNPPTLPSVDDTAAASKTGFGQEQVKSEPPDDTTVRRNELR